jgi:molybdopterin converting factor small subunit
MSVEIELFGQLMSNTERRQVLEIAKPTLIREVMNKLGLEEEKVGLITVDGVQSEPDQYVHPGSRLCLFPHMSGG